MAVCDSPTLSNGEGVTPTTAAACDSPTLSNLEGITPKGTGYGGVWTATDDFEARKRRTKWVRPASTPVAKTALPPRLYVDNKTIIREVHDICDLRSGDHCMIAINLVRCLSPMLDHFVGFLGSIEMIYFYHHFIMIDDVTHVDEQGIPRRKDGEMAYLVEYANTIPEALTEISELAGSWKKWPSAAARFLLDKSRCQRSALADYGDTKHLYRVVENTTAEDRERIVEEALRVMEKPKTYHVLFNNCEHTTNHIASGHFTSPSLHFGIWGFCRACMCILGYVCLHLLGGACYERFCISRPLSALIVYHVLATVPVVLQALVSFVTICHAVWKQHTQSLISRDDCYHLIGKEFARMIVVGGGAATAISFMPEMASHTERYVLTGVLVLITYLLSDVVYNFFAHAVMRLVLIPVWGRVWLIGCEDPSPMAEAEERTNKKED